MLVSYIKKPGMIAHNGKIKLLRRSKEITMIGSRGNIVVAEDKKRNRTPSLFEYGVSGCVGMETGSTLPCRTFN
jgi:hypothetical protein